MRVIVQLLFLSACLLGSSALVAQDFLRANYAPNSRPNQLNVCGDNDIAIYRVERATGAPTSSGIQATIRLFKGIEAVGLLASSSSPGVSLVSLADPTRPVISLPNISPSNSSVDIALILKAKCGILDTINANNLVDVRDQISLRFTNLGQPRIELETIDPYIAAIRSPSFSISTSLSQMPLRVGQTVTRSVEIANGSFSGYADTVVYELLQGRGAALRSIRVNGVTKTFVKTPNAAGDTLITVVLRGSDFLGNRNGINPGNGDARFDSDERLLLEEVLYIKSCRDTRIARHTTLFGCEGNYCATTVLPTDLPIGSGQPAISIKRSASFPDVQVGYCQLGEMTLWVSNLGRETDPTFGEARNLSVSAVADFGGALAANGYRIARIDIAGQSLSSLARVVRLDTLAAFNVDPDGPGVGLEDLDGDGYFDDLAVLDSFPIKIFYEFDCAANRVYYLDVNCANDAATTFQAFIYYENGCGTYIDASAPSVHSPRNIQDDFEQRTQPDAFADGAPFLVELEFGRLVFDFDNSCSAAAELRAYVVLPTGIIINSATSFLNRGGGPGMPLLGVSYAADTAMLRFSPAGELALSGVYNLTLGFTADCTAALSETSFPTTVSYYCPDCACEHIWICEDLGGPWIHKIAPPCAIADLYPCAQGIQGASFSIERTTLGFYDPGFANPMTANDANLKAAIPADSVLIAMDGLVGDNPVSDSLGVILHYFTPNKLTDTSGLFLLGAGTFSWKNAGSWRSATVPAVTHLLQTADEETWQRYDISSVLTNNGWILVPGDSIRFRGSFEINPEGPIETSYEFVEDLRGGFYASRDGVETICDQFGDIFRVGRPFTVFGVPSAGDYPKGCAPTTLDFRLTGINRGYIDEFGAEYRRAARLDSLILEFDTAILSAYDSLSVELSVANHPTEGSNFFPIRPLSDFPDGRYVLYLDTLDYSAELVTNHSYLYNLRINLTPNCSSIRSSANGDEFYPMRALPHYRDRYYARDIGSGSRVLPVTEDIPFVMTYEDPAQLRMDIITSPYQRIVNDSAYVVMEICNISDRADAARSWVIFDDLGALTVEEVHLIDNPASPVPLDVLSYSGGSYVNVEGLQRVNGINSSVQVCNLLRFKIRVNGCGINGIQFGAGWGCEAAVPLGWTPDLDPGCIDDTGLSTFEPIAPFLESGLVSQPVAPVDLCTPIVMEFLVNNAQPGTAYDVVSGFHMPAGFGYVAGSAQVAYPPSAPFQTTVTDFVPSDTTIRGFGMQFSDLAAVHPFLGSNGLAGFNAVAPSDSNRFVLRLTFESDCNFRSGSIVYFDAEGNEACGDRTNLAATESAAIQISGTTPDGSHAYDIGFDPAARISISQSTSSIEVFVTNVGTAASDADDVIEVTLPSGFTYQAGSAEGVLPTGYLPGEPRILLLGGISKLEWDLPIGLSPDETARLRFDVAPSVLGCDQNLQAALAAIRYVTATCVAGGSNCRIPTDITRGGAELSTIPSGDEFMVTFVQNSAQCAGANDEQIDVEIQLSTTGFSLSGANLIIALYYDVNGDGRINAGDGLIQNSALPTSPGDTAVTYTFSQVLDRSEVGGLILRIDSTGLPLCRPQEIVIPLPPLDNAATQDQYTVCISDAATLTLGSTACNGSTNITYTWSTAPAGFENLLSNPTVPAPTLQIAAPYSGPDTLLFILLSERLGVGTTSDTVTILVGPGVVLGQGPTETINFGDQIVLLPNILSGRAPLSYSWSPATGLSSDTDAQPIAAPEFSTTYVLTVSDAFGCVAMTTHEVVVRSPIIPTASTLDTTLCPNAIIQLSVGGGSVVDWTADPANPNQGGISSNSGSQVDFAPLGGIGIYRFIATVSDPTFPGYSDTISIRINSELGSSCLGRCEAVTLTSEIVTNTNCGESTGAIQLAYATTLSDYQLEWLGESNNSLGINTLSLSNLPPGVYTLRARNTIDSVCSFQHQVYVSASNAPLPEIISTPASCGQADGSASLTIAGVDILWPDGSTAASRSDLASGIYRVRIAAADDPSCLRFIQVDIAETGGLALSYTINQLPTCGAADGSVSLEVTGGSGSYSYSWSSNASSQNNLSAGVYHVKITDQLTGCTDSISFVLPNAGPGVIVTIGASRDPSCAGSRDGGISYTLQPDAGLIEPLDSIWLSERGDTVANGSLGSGQYCLLITDANGCVVGGSCTTLSDPLPIYVDLDIGIACGVDNGTVDIIVRSGRQPFNFTFSNGTVSSTLSNGGFGVGAQNLLIRDAFNCSASVDFSVSGCQPCNYINNPGDTSLIQTGCNGIASVCIAGIATRASTIQIFTNGAPYSGPQLPCDYGRTRLTYLIGVHSFAVPSTVRWSVAGVEYSATVSSLNELISFFQVNDVAGNWQYDAASLAIVGGQARLSYSTLKLQRQGSSIVSTIAYNERIEPFGLSIALTPGFHRIVVLDSEAACADTLYARIVCAPIDTQVVNVVVNTTGQFCLNTADLLGNYVSIRNTCVDTSKAGYGSPLDTCISVQGNVIGTQLGCWVMCDAFGICDTTIVRINVLPNNATFSWRDTVFVGAADALCLTTSELGLPGNVLTISNTCPQASGVEVEYTIDNGTACIDYRGLAVGENPACLRLCDELGNCVNGTLTISVITAPILGKLLVYDTIFINQASSFCLDTLSNLADFSIRSAPDSLVETSLDSTGRCALYRGLRLGTDTLGVVGIRTDGSEYPVCVVITVAPYSGGLVATDDSICTVRNSAIRINVLANDTLFGDLISFRLVTDPRSFDGSVVVNPDRSITFTPAADICGRDVSFDYEVCNGNTSASGGGCAQATITICIECEGLTIFTAISPNGDGLNETFWVDNIEDFPNNRLQIFNRWGNLVYETSGYLNQWAGTYNGNLLPDGAYFYLLDVTADGQTKTYNGFVEIMR